ncbi:MAG TPA: hypothetical protein VMU41_08600 [Candidatus Binataceae bacterium]|nr:hypothetical protein [Candidatus Binataceae bacterium]
MGITKKPSKPKARDRAKEEKIKEIVREADLKKFDPDLDEMIHPSKPANDK